jgi:hypothetical protein
MMQRALLDPLSVGGCDDLLPACVCGARTASRSGNTVVAGKNYRLKRPCAAVGAAPFATTNAMREASRVRSLSLPPATIVAVANQREAGTDGLFGAPALRS